MIHFAYPNVKLTTGEFIGCGRYLTCETHPGDEYEQAAPKLTKNLSKVKTAASILFPGGIIGSPRDIYEKKDDPKQSYQGDSLCLAYLLALIARARDVRLGLSERDIWCTGAIDIADGKRPVIEAVDPQGFELKLNAFLSPWQKDTLFIVPEPLLDISHEKLIREQGPDLLGITELEELLKQGPLKKKTVLYVPSFGLKDLLDMLFEAPDRPRREPVPVVNDVPNRSRKEPVLGDSWTEPITGMEFVYIPPGKFMMGSPEDEPERYDDEKQHKVILTQGFYMQTTPVTQGQWKAVMGNNPSYFNLWEALKKGRLRGNTDCPVENVSWHDAQKFMEKLNASGGEYEYRLPTEAQWEYACRAGTTTPFWTGKCLNTDQANYNGNRPLRGCPKGEYREKTTPVKTFAPNPWGLYDMHGNVSEWCSDWFDDYPDGPVTDPVGPSNGALRVIRGGSWLNNARCCRSVLRYGCTPDLRNNDLGFRVLAVRRHK